jgi:anti-sigma factor RsiW
MRNDRIAHLSSEQLAEFMTGQPSPQVAQLVARHVQDCPACRDQVVSFGEALGGFRGAVRAWSEEQANAVRAIPAGVGEPRSWAASHQLVWALLMAAVFIIASFVIPRRGGDQATNSDALLLNQVDSQVSRSVPSSMEPLMKLVVQK